MIRLTTLKAGPNYNAGLVTMLLRDHNSSLTEEAFLALERGPNLARMR